MMISEKKRQARQKAGLSKAELSAAAEITIDALCSYEDGTTDPNIHDLVNLSRVLGVSFFYLTHRDSEDPSEHIHLQEAVFEFYDRFGADALERYTKAVNMELKEIRQAHEVEHYRSRCQDFLTPGKLQ